jgi:subtilisin family serine protease
LFYAPYPNDPQGAHGTDVANIITGGAGLRAALQHYLRNVIKINFVNVRSPTKVGVYPEYTITDGNISRAVSFALSHGATIVNFSFEADGALEFLKDPGYAHVLFVVAAGNDHKELGGKGTYPGNYGGHAVAETANHFITVVAADGNGSRAKDFSNYGASYADLAAPGCAIPFLKGFSGLGNHGTSFAAPLVTMAAALLRAFGVGDSGPKAIKNRLRVSVDYDLNLESDVDWSGRLNIPKALSLYQDVLETAAGPPQFGKFRTPDGLLHCEGGPSLDMSYVKKVWMRDKANGVLGVLKEDDLGNVIEYKCTPSVAEFELIGDDSKQELKIHWNDFVDYVPRYYSQ